MTTHTVFAVRDTCVGAFLMPWFFQNRAAAVRALGDVVNKPGDLWGCQREIGDIQQEFGHGAACAAGYRTWPAMGQHIRLDGAGSCAGILSASEFWCDKLQQISI